MPGAERTSRAGQSSGRAGRRASQADEPGGRAELSRCEGRSTRARRTGETPDTILFFFLKIVSMVSEPNKMTAAHSIAVEANHKTLKPIKKTTATRATAGDPGHVGRDYSTFVSKRNHSPLMKKKPSHGTLLAEGGAAELSRDQRGGPSLGREPPSMPTVIYSVVRLP